MALKREWSRLPGRDEEREIFATTLARAIEGLPSLLLYEGEPGGGKTSLLDEIATSPLLPRRRIRVALIPLREDDTLEAVTRAARALTRNAFWARLGGRRRFGGAAGRILPDWIGAIPGWGDLVEAIVHTVSAVRKRKRRAAGPPLPEGLEDIHRHARRRPLAILFDDLHRATPATVDRLRRIMTVAETGTRLLIIGSFVSPPPGGPVPAIRTLVDVLPPDRRVHRRLRPLDDEALDAWFSEQFPGAQPSPALRVWLAQHTGGQPAAMERAIEGLVERDVLRRDGAGWTLGEFGAGIETPVEVPPDIDLGALGEDAASLLRAASTLGNDFDGQRLARLSGRDELQVEDQLAVAVRFGLLEVVGEIDLPDGDIATAYRFRSSAVRAALSGRATANARPGYDIGSGPSA
jgi:predicted ATPase